jgi:hypothetical protein
LPDDELNLTITALVGVTEAAAELLDEYFYYDDDPPEAERLKSAVTLAWIALPKQFARKDEIA